MAGDYRSRSASRRRPAAPATADPEPAPSPAAQDIRLLDIVPREPISWRPTEVRLYSKRHRNDNPRAKYPIKFYSKVEVVDPIGTDNMGQEIAWPYITQSYESDNRQRNWPPHFTLLKRVDLTEDEADELEGLLIRTLGEHMFMAREPNVKWRLDSFEPLVGGDRLPYKALGDSRPEAEIRPEDRLPGNWECLRFTTLAGEEANTRTIDHDTPLGQCLEKLRLKVLSYLIFKGPKADRNLNMWEAHVHL